MGYRKMIKYGNIIEIYQYEKNLSNYQREGIRKYPQRTRVSLLASNRADTIQSVFKKRQDNAQRTRVVFTRLVAANIDGIEKPLLFTFTYAENIISLRQGYKDFRSFVQSLRNKFGKKFSYIAVPEFQKRGAVHFHALFWGIPIEVFREQRLSRVVDKIWGHGFVFMKLTDGDVRLSGYLAKYMSKAYTDERLSGQKSYTASRNIKRPFQQEIPGLYNVWSDYDLEQSEPLQKSEYGTKWLGKCSKKIYKLIKI